ncbi:MAG: 3-dehydroquinate synthase [Oscillospiraceae bacterium]|jgi:3-dehydroquinate synthase|nr:3-dehydroquinate synthase [Oscillospiraceae bacterium]
MCNFIADVYNGQRIFVGTDKNLFAFYGEPLKRVLAQLGFESIFVVIEPGEASKNFNNIRDVCEVLAKNKCRRDELLLAFGGGVVTDFFGFVAAIYMRGLRCILMPSSLLAQIDAAIGGKVAVNLSVSKNLVGAFYNPDLVLCNLALIEKLPKKEILNGLGEVVKYALLYDSWLWPFLKRSTLASVCENLEVIVKECIKIKQLFISEDLCEKNGQRVMLNLGHTIGHALEKHLNYEKNHGECVGNGLIEVLKLGVGCGLNTQLLLEEVSGVLFRLGVCKELDIDLLLLKDYILRDKKTTNVINFVMLSDVGKPILKQLNLFFIS